MAVQSTSHQLDDTFLVWVDLTCGCATGGCGLWYDSHSSFDDSRRQMRVGMDLSWLGLLDCYRDSHRLRVKCAWARQGMLSRWRSRIRRRKKVQALLENRHENQERAILDCYVNE